MASQQQHSPQSYQHGGAYSSSTAFHHTNHTAPADMTTQQQEAPRTHQPATHHTSHHSSRGQGTAAFLKDFNLVAEAAKRAQMAASFGDHGSGVLGRGKFLKDKC
ncbi:hypothetical protein AJ78_07463 [Emergomyces pasteurianus Ep9510]|uniref:Uncharacterized protein n=1 Tax=Emergomyces pasteurianus Ep9510 TaxID=1447872 RepID=A0A1J9P7H7_9EURO|nr:hypothetical protein AJ78_07463 [Emergomyces pasteurianus Ep9510]